MRLPFLAALAAVLALAACSLPALDKEGDAAARALYQEVASGADLSKDEHLDDSLKAPETLAQLAEVRRLIPDGAPTKVDNRSWNFNTDTGGTRAQLIHAYHYPQRTLIAETVMFKAPGSKAWKIIGFHVKVEGATPVEPNPVTTEGSAVKT